MSSTPRARLITPTASKMVACLSLSTSHVLFAGALVGGRQREDGGGGNGGGAAALKRLPLLILELYCFPCL